VVSIVFKAVAGLVAGVVAGALGLAFLPRVEPSALTPRSQVEKPNFLLPVVATTPSSVPHAAATLAVATETAAATPSPAASATPVASATPDKAPPRMSALALPASPPPTPVAEKPASAAAPANPSGVAVAVKTEAPSSLKPAPQDAARWSVRGLVALAKGDLSTARLFLSRAAETGDARAWVALADTYDPAMLAKLGVVFAPGDAARARDCLVKAMAAGVVVPKDRLAALDSGVQPLR